MARADSGDPRHIEGRALTLNFKARADSCDPRQRSARPGGLIQAIRHKPEAARVDSGESPSRDAGGYPRQGPDCQ